MKTKYQLQTITGKELEVAIQSMTPWLCKLCAGK